MEGICGKRNRFIKCAEKFYPGGSWEEALEIREKGEGDAVLKLASIQIRHKECRSEYDIRSLLAPVGATIIRQDGSEARGGTLCPALILICRSRRIRKV